jgi:glycosyltransferase involved in cell wall biosynthesis
VVDGETGHLVPEGEPGPLGDALLGLVRDPARRRALGAAGRARAVARLTWDAVAARYREGYTAALAGATP